MTTANFDLTFVFNIDEDDTWVGAGVGLWVCIFVNLCVIICVGYSLCNIIFIKNCVNWIYVMSLTSQFLYVRDYCTTDCLIKYLIHELTKQTLT